MVDFEGTFTVRVSSDDAAGTVKVTATSSDDWTVALRNEIASALSDGSTNGRSEDWAEGCEPLDQRIAELAYILYERSGFQDGKDLEHWLEAERQVKAVRDQAA